jgi:hypothetical protein
MTHENLSRLRAPRNNILRYRRLLGTQLTDFERHKVWSWIEGELRSPSLPDRPQAARKGLA